MSGRAPERCELCGRPERLTRHHLIPRTLHRNRRVRRRWSREALTRAILWVCRPCHDQIHQLIPEKQLAEHYHTREALLAHAELRRFVEWIRSRPPGFRPRSRSWKQRLNRR